MKTMVAGLGSLVLSVLLSSNAFAQEAPPPAPQIAPIQAAPAAPQPAPTNWVYSYPTGQWVYTATDGWVWIPAGASTSYAEGVPYAYLYTPAYGWTWYVSPWGGGPYRYGSWVAHPWRPYGWRGGWVARPHVVVRLGGGHRYSYRHR